MYLLVMILDKTSDMQNVIAKFREIGVTGATIFDSIGIGRHTLFPKDIPLIASLWRVLDPEKRTYNHTIFSVIRDRKTVDSAIEAAKQICGDFSRPDVGIIFTVKIEDVIGFNISPSADEERS